MKDIRVHNPLDVLQIRADMVRFWNSSLGQNLAAEYQRIHQGQFVGLDKLQGQLWRLGTPYWVSPDMMDVLNVAAPSMPSQALDTEDPPAMYGCAILAGSLVGIETNPELIRLLDGRLSVGALCWWPFINSTTGRPAIHITCYSHVSETLMARRYEAAGLSRPPLWHLGGGSWYLGEELEEVDGEEDDTIIASMVEDRRRVAALWTLSQQRLAVQTQIQPDRALARRLRREDIPPDPVTVITLRRSIGTATGYEEHEGREYSHRWIVGGHWRNQYLPSTDSHRLQWISPYVKGPEDKPLVVKDKVYSWSR